ncbi:MAG: hypothetical protein K9N06_06285 [Candidatus Cloacimonetes bacterium]|nr:hypothetical protein [Candidatus Cloacimonadota bacterium]
MFAKPSLLYQYYSGYTQGHVAMPYKNKFGLTYMRIYVYPQSFTDHQVEFGNECRAVTTTWPDADASFQADMQLYADAWNETQQPGHNEIRDLSDFNLFIKGCFAAGEASSFDLKTLTVDNFGGEAGDLLGTAAPNVGNLIIAAGLPTCGLDLATLNNPIVAA